MGRLRSLQVGRAVAALLVVAYHADGSIFRTPKLWSETALGGFFAFGHAGVYFFFVLSGFIIAAAHSRDIGQPDRAPNYLMRRIIRVYPVYWIVLIPIAAIYFARPGLSKPELTAHWVIANSFALIGLYNRSSLAVAWTLFHEILFYLLFALVIVNRRIGSMVLAGWMAACLLTSVFFPDAVRGIYALALVNLLFGVGLGCFAATRRRGVPAPACVTGLGCLGFLAAGLYENRFGFADVAGSVASYGASSALIVLGLVSRERIRPIAVSRLPLLFGDASFSIYLVHYPVLSIVARLWLKVFGKAVPVDLAYIGIVVVCVAIGVGFHLVVEKPLTHVLMARWRERERPAGATVSAASR